MSPDRFRIGFVPLVDALFGPVGIPAEWEGYAR